MISALGNIWSIVEQSMVEAELIESVALSTRRLSLSTCMRGIAFANKDDEGSLAAREAQRLTESSRK